MELRNILNLEELHKYKLHAARYNNIDQPLDVFIKDREEWNKWNSWQGSKDEFNRTYIFSIIKFYSEEDTWLFGGIFKVLNRTYEKNAQSYTIELQDQGKELIGRLKFVGSFPRGKAFLMENFYHKLSISEVLKKPYDGEVFCGYENISLDFSMLEIIYKNDLLDWKTALQNIKGIYIIVDKSNGLKYIGSAYGTTGIWSRWNEYIETGHGWNKGLVGLENLSSSYCRENFKITLIEAMPFKTDDAVIMKRENFWKNALLTRDFGYNSN